MLNLETTLRITQNLTQEANLTSRFSKVDLDAIGEHVSAGYDRDKQSRAKWEARTESALNLALQVSKAKNFPWENCSNVAFPLVTIAALQFHSQAYPAIIQGTEVAKYRVIGPDPTGKKKERSLRLGPHMSYQLLEEDQPWEEQHDRMLLSLPIVGSCFKKSYYSNSLGHNVSELVLAHDLVMDYFAKSVEDCARKTHIIPLYRNEIYERCVTGVFQDILKEDWYLDHAQIETSAHQSEEDRRAGRSTPQSDSDTPFTTLEQHCLLDLDKDGYAEPYIVTFEQSSKTVLRIVANYEWKDVNRLSTGRIVKIRPTEFFTGYVFIPSPDGSVYGLGFGTLLGSLNESVNTILNQLIDAGTMSVAAGGFLARGAKLRGGRYTFSPFEWKTLDSSSDDIKKSMLPLPVREPSMVLYTLLSLIITYAGRVAGTTETQVGENPGQNTPAQTTQTMVDQGMKVYKAIFKRVCRSMKEEFKKLYILNAINLPDEPTYFGTTDLWVQRLDYLEDPRGVAPVADPNVVSEAMRFQIATAVKQSAMTTPGYDIPAVERNWLQALHVEGYEVLYPGPDKVQPLTNPKVQVEQIKQQAKQAELQFRQLEFVANLQEERKLNQAKIVELMAKAALELEQAGGVKTGHQIAAFEAAIGALKLHHDVLTKQIELLMKGMENEQAGQGATGGGVPRLAGPSHNSPGKGVSPAAVGAGG